MMLFSIESLGHLRSLLRHDSNKNRPRIVICAGTACQASGSSGVIRVAKKFILQEDLLDKVGLRITGCHGFCEMGPFILTEPQRAFYTQISLDDVPRIIRAMLAGTYVEELLYRDPATGKRYYRFDDIPFFKHQQRTILGTNQKIDPIRVYDYIAEQGYEGLERVLTTGDPGWVLREVEQSGLRGRGGAGFPTGLKWQLLARQPAAGGKFLVCNADEGDPGAYMDRSILEGNPHSIIEGMTIGAYATGATEGIVYVRTEYPLAIKHLTIALRQARELGLLGKNILRSALSFDISIVRGAGAFVCGEETALIRSVEGKTGEPRQRPPFPVQKGIFGRPTAINNVETWANIPVIIRLGASQFSRVGTKGNSGTKVFSLVGKVKNTGLVEVPMGITIGEIVHDIGGGPSGEAKVKAVQTGGPSGGCIPVERFDLPIDYDSLTEAGSIMGSGGMIVMDQNTCMVDVAKYYMNFLKEESCGKCFSCRKGTQRMHEILDDITKGKGTLEHLERLEELGLVVKDASMCGLGQTASNPVLSTLRYFRDEYEAHILDKRCPAAVCSALFRSPCQHACPVGMDVPAYVALVRAGRLDDAYKVLTRTNPFPAICGRVCGHECQIRCRRSQLDGAVAIMHLKRFISDSAHKPPVEPLPTLRVEHVAVIGAGPSGLTAALELRKRGYRVTVFEELPEAGGMLRYGIPAYRLPRHVLDEEIDRILGTGIELHANTRVGRDVTFAQIDRDFDAIFIAVGAHRSLPLGVPGEEVSGVHGAVEWLRAYNTTGTAPIGNRVAVIGGGNSAVDAARTAKRLGAESVTVYYRRMRADMPAQKTEIHAAEEEGIEIVELVAPAAVTAANGSVGGLQMRRMELRGFDRSGRKRPVAIPGSEFAVAVDTVLSAIGQTPVLDFLGSARVRASEVTIEVDRDLRTTNSKVWAGGDAVTGPAMVIDAIRAGQRAARAIDASIREAAGEQPWMAPDDERIEIPVDLVGTDDEAAERPPAAMPAADPESRRHDFREVELGYSLELAMADAARCMRCDLTTKEVLAVGIEEREAVAPRCGTEQAKSERS
jgi:NADH-quinone oxidoreductase subunit F